MIDEEIKAFYGDNLDPMPLEELCRHLSTGLYQPAAGAEQMQRQSYALDQIFYRLTQDILAKQMERGDDPAEALAMVLQVQRQSLEAAKNAKSNEYLDALIHRMSGPSPLQQKAIERLQELKNETWHLNREDPYHDPFAYLSNDQDPPPPKTGKQKEGD